MLAERWEDLGVALVVVLPGDGLGRVPDLGVGGVHGRARQQLGPGHRAQVVADALVEVALEVPHGVLSNEVAYYLPFYAVVDCLPVGRAGSTVSGARLPRPG